jgi:hypothetical protein
MRYLSGMVTLCLAATIAPDMVISSAAIDVRPTKEHIDAALARGKEAAQQHRQPDTFYVRFGGSDGLQPGGFLVTKLGSLSVMAAHMALRGLEPSQSDIAQVIEAPTMLVNAVIFGDAPSFAMDSYVILDQAGKAIKPATVRFDGQARRSAAWPDSPRFAAKVVASFNYADFDPAAQTLVTIFPARGGEVSFSLDFAQIE